MEQLIAILTDIAISYGSWGMFVAAFLAGSILPFSSESVMLALLAAGVSPWTLLLMASTGNSLGGITCYYIGRLGKTEWIERYLRISHERIEKTKAFLHGRGAVMALFVALPYVGDAIVVVLGLMRSNVYLTTLTMLIGKAVRYALIILAIEGVNSLI